MTPILIVVFAWYVGTGLIALLNRMPGRAPALGLVLGAVLAGAAIAGIEASHDMATVAGAYLAFGAAFLLWAWLEHSYLAGVITGPERGPCPPGLTGRPKFVKAVGLSLYHELSVIAVGVMLLWASTGAQNRVAAWTFVTLWIMRWSAKLNLYLGVASMDIGLLPERLRYLATYMAQKPMNALFPLSVLGGLALVAFHIVTVQGGGTGTHATVAATLLATITALAVLEHCVMMIPFRDSGLWRWAADRTRARV